MVARRELKKPARMEMDEPARLWVIKHARENYWRVAAYYSLEDLIQDGFFTWYRVVSGQLSKGKRKAGDPVSMMHTYKYITDRPHIMALFKSAYHNHITDLANKRTACSPFNHAVEDWMDAPDDEVASAHLLISSAPEPVRKALALFTTDEGRAEMSKPYLVKNGHRETTNERLSKLTGHDGDLAGLIKQHIGIETTPVRPQQPKSTTSNYALLRLQGFSPDKALLLDKLSNLATSIRLERGDSLRSAKKPMARAVACGKWLSEAKELCQKAGRCFERWIVENCSFCARTARKYMWLCRKASGLDNLLSMSIAGARRCILSFAV